MLIVGAVEFPCVVALQLLHIGWLLSFLHGVARKNTPRADEFTWGVNQSACGVDFSRRCGTIMTGLRLFSYTHCLAVYDVDGRRQLALKPFHGDTLSDEDATQVVHIHRGIGRK